MKLAELYSRLSPVLRPLGIPYAFLMRQRRSLYRQELLRSYRPFSPVVSVGNISWGGTGKTPLTAWLLQWSEDNGLKAVVLSRGYMGKPGKRPLLVRRDTAVEQSGDEALLLARAFSRASVVVFPKRIQAAQFAENCLAPDLLVLDDGMQHLALQRSIDIVLLSPEDLREEWDRVIPSGTWREGCSALSAASVFCIKAGAEEFEELAPLAQKRLARFGRPLFSFTLAPLGLRPVFPREGKNHPLLPPGEYRDRPYLLVSGVGKPEQVKSTAHELMGRDPVFHFDFDDHYPYTEADIQAFLGMSPAPLPVVCTAKDAVKLKSFSEVWGSSPLWTLETRVEFGPCIDFSGQGEAPPTFPVWWENWWKNRPTGSRAKGGN